MELHQVCLPFSDRAEARLTDDSLSVPPSYIDVIATNTVNSQTYTIAANQSYDPTGTVVWDTNQFTQTTDLPFVVATYTLMVCLIYGLRC